MTPRNLIGPRDDPYRYAGGIALASLPTPHRIQARVLGVAVHAYRAGHAIQSTSYLSELCCPISSCTGSTPCPALFTSRRLAGSIRPLCNNAKPLLCRRPVNLEWTSFWLYA